MDNVGSTVRTLLDEPATIHTYAEIDRRTALVKPTFHIGGGAEAVLKIGIIGVYQTSRAFRHERLFGETQKACCHIATGFRFYKYCIANVVYG
jgi:hypothetical protein